MTNSIKPIHITICIHTQRAYSANLRNILRDELISIIEKDTHSSILRTQSEYNETCKIHGISQLDIQLDLFMIIDKTRFLANKASIFRWIVKPFYTTKAIIHQLEVTLRRSVKRAICISDPLGINSSITHIRITRMV
jgi:hypothetical protein